MNIEEARKVLWVRTNPRPLGELLDERLLTRENLEWAVKWAYNFKLREAAKVLLDSLNSSPVKVAESTNEPDIHIQEAGIEVGISLRSASSTAWPFPPYKGQTMGKLVESRKLSLRDLGYAVEKAWDERVRRAATLYLLQRLDQIVKSPVPSTGFVQVVPGGRSFAQRRETFLTLLQGLWLGFTFAFAFYFLFPALRGAGKANSEAISFSEFISRPNGILSFVIGLGLLIFLGWIFNFVFERINKKIEERIEAYRLGQEGEDAVVQLIVQALDGNWNLFRNISLPGRSKGDLDLVLVGPPGVWALEVKNFRGEYRNIGETWDKKNGKNWKPAKANPSRQAQNSTYRLKNFLKADNLNVFVNSAVIWANPEGSLTVENPTVAVWRYDSIPDELGNIWQGEKLSEGERSKIVAKLTKLCERQKSAN